jgi:glycine cleavage system H lipoate-binding protein
MAAKVNITIDQGSTFSTYLVLTDSSGTVLDLTGYSVYSQIRKWYTSSTATVFDIAIANATTGTILLSLTANTTANLAAGKYVYDVESHDTANQVARIIEGSITVTPEVTRI